MELVQLETKIAAPMERCFLLSLNMDLHTESTAKTKEQAVGGVVHGLIGPGETVTFRARHFGLLLEHTSIISAYNRPYFFEDSMTRDVCELRASSLLYRRWARDIDAG